MLDFLKQFSAWSIFDQVVCYLFIIQFIWGATNKFGKKDEFNEDFLSLDAMKSLRGFAALGVIIHHISQEPCFQEEGILSPFVNAGAYFVAIFFFCSGYGLLKSYITKENYLKGFIKKRIVKSIVVPFYINVIIYGILIALVKIPLDKVQWITNFAGITMMNTYAWFPIVLALLYLVFFITFKIFKKPNQRPIAFAIILIFIIAMGVGCMINGHFAWWAGPDNWWMDDHFWETSMKWWMDQKIFWFHGEWWVNSAPAFFTGLVFANYEKQIVAFFKKKYWIKYHVLLIFTMIFYKLSAWGQAHFGYWTEFNFKGPEIDTEIYTYFCQVPLFLVLGLTIIIFMMKYHVSNPVSRFFGKYSLHTYLMNLAALTALRFLEYNFDESPFYLGGKYNNLLVYGVGVVILTVLFGVGEQKITEAVQKLLFTKRVKKVAYVANDGLIDSADAPLDYRAVRKAEAAEAKAAEASETGSGKKDVKSAEADKTEMADPEKKPEAKEEPQKESSSAQKKPSSGSGPNNNGSKKKKNNKK